MVLQDQSLVLQQVIDGISAGVGHSKPWSGWVVADLVSPGCWGLPTQARDRASSSMPRMSGDLSHACDYGWHHSSSPVRSGTSSSAAVASEGQGQLSQGQHRGMLAQRSPQIQHTWFF